MTKDTGKFRQSFTELLWERSEKPEHLWHYTDGAGISGIARSTSLWCTEYRYLNDREEMSTFAVRLQAFLSHELERLWDKKDVNRVISASDLYRTWHVFICSFCTDADRNEHWHQYARKAGYALGFDPLMLRPLSQAQGFALGRVIYGDEQARDIATGIIKDQQSIWESFKSPLSEEEIRKVSHFVCKLILSCAPFFKPLSFERESEWRLVKITGIADDKIQIQPSKPFGLRSYYPFSFRHAHKNKVPAGLIPRVLTGPGNATEGWSRANTVYSLLQRAGFETRVSESKSSLRFLE